MHLSFFSQGREQGEILPAHPLQDRYSQRPNFERSGTGGNGVVCNGGVAAREHDVRLAGDGCRAVGCGWDGEGETSVDGGCAVGWD